MKKLLALLLSLTMALSLAVSATSQSADGLLLTQAKTENVELTTNAHLIRSGDCFTITPSFKNAVNGNVAILKFTFDKLKFEYCGFTGGGNVTLLNTEQTDNGVKLTLMVPDYNMATLGDVLFSARDDAKLENADNIIGLEADYVLKQGTDEKIIKTETVSITFSTTNYPDNFSLIALSNLIDAFGITSEHAEWWRYRFFDFNNNKEIDVCDIVYVAQRIVAGGWDGYVPDPGDGSDLTINLWSSASLFKVGENGTVIFNASYVVGLDSLDLTNVTTGQKYKMLDNGDLNNGDDIAGDGAYSVKIIIDTSVKRDCIFVVNSNDGAESNSIIISLYEGLSDEDVDNVLKTVRSVKEKSTEIIAKHGVNDDAAKAEIIKHLENLEEDGHIHNVQIDPNDSNLVTFRYASGVLGGYLLEEFDEDFRGLAASDKNVEAETTTTFDREHNERYSRHFETEESELFEPFASNTAVSNDFPGQNQALILSSFSYEGSSKANLEKCNDVKKYLENQGFHVKIEEQATVKSFYNLNKYGTILINTHGMTRGGLASIALAEVATKEKIKEYERHLEHEEIWVAITNTEEDGNFWIFPKFFSSNYHSVSNKLPNSLVYLGLCYSAINTSLSSALFEAGAAAVFAYDRDVQFSYCDRFMVTLFRHLSEGYTTSEALEKTKKDEGETDAYGVSCMLAPGSDRNLRIISEEIVNGGFEKDIPFFGWIRIGDVRHISGLGNLRPTEGFKMAMLATGIGSLQGSIIAIYDGTQGSIMQQTIRLTQNKSTLTFDYNMLSEEPPEWVGSRYNDTFRAEILDAEGNLIAKVVEESVNTSNWYAYPVVDDLFFTVGSQTGRRVYQTGWKTAAVDLTQYAGQTITLRFMVYDLGDMQYDSAVLIDKVVLK